MSDIPTILFSFIHWLYKLLTLKLANLLQIKESIVGEIRREIVSGLLAAVSPQSRSTTAKQDTEP